MLITLTTDFGDADGFVGVIKGVLHSICPQARLVDVAQAVPAGDIAHGAWVLRSIWGWFPAGTVHLAVIDPGVGGRRPPLVVQAAGQYWVAPDNGVLAWMLHENAAAGLPARAWVFEDTRFRLEPVSRTFHGRDLFAPAAAFLACGVDPAEMGREIPARIGSPGGLEGGPIWPWLPRPGDDPAFGHIAHIDVFGNAITTVPASLLPDPGAGHDNGSIAVSLEIETASGPRLVVGIASAYEAIPRGEGRLIAGSSGLIEIAFDRASAALGLDLRRGDRVRLRI